MTKETAKEILSEMILSMVSKDGKSINLPIKDVNLPMIRVPEPQIAQTLQQRENIDNQTIIFETHSFKNLLKIVYDL